MPTHEIKSCLRCHTEFECKVGAVWQCLCQAVKLTSAHREYIAQRYTDCLCAVCLAVLKAEYDELLYKSG